MEEGSHRAHSPGLIVAHVHSWVLAILHASSSSLLGRGGHLRSCPLSSGVVALNGGLFCGPWGCDHLWALNLHEWRVMVVNGGVVHGHSMWVGSSRLWAVVVVLGGVMFICV